MARNKMQQEVVNVCCVHQRTEQTEEENEMQHEKIDTSKFSKCKSSQLCWTAKCVCCKRENNMEKTCFKLLQS